MMNCDWSEHALQQTWIFRSAYFAPKVKLIELNVSLIESGNGKLDLRKIYGYFVIKPCFPQNYLTTIIYL